MSADLSESDIINISKKIPGRFEPVEVVLERQDDTSSIPTEDIMSTDSGINKEEDPKSVELDNMEGKGDEHKSIEKTPASPRRRGRKPKSAE